MEPIAVGELNLNPRRWLYHTPAEISLLLIGLNRRLEDREEREAIWVAAILNTQVKDKVTPQQLLGRPTRAMREDAKRREQEKKDSSE